MPQVRYSGTAWDCCLNDYAYASGLDRWGWAWEFLRRSEDYHRDFRVNRAGHPVPIKHKSGAKILRLRRRMPSAEQWGLYCFADPFQTADEAHVFWLKHLLRNQVDCNLQTANDNKLEVLSLTSFSGKRRVLITQGDEIVVVADRQMSACMSIHNPTFLTHECNVAFEIPSLENPSATIEAVQTLRQLRTNQPATDSGQDCSQSKYRNYLIALDGRLAGRSYREIAEVLYGSDRIGACWTDDSRGYKSKVRRAVERGLALMNGGYRDLL